MYYLLYEPSREYMNDESFVLFQTDANQPLAERFIPYYFERYQVLGIFPNFSTIDTQTVEMVKINEEEIIHKFERQGLKNQTRHEHEEKRAAYLTPWREKIDELNRRLLLTEAEMNRTIFKHFDPSEATESLEKELNEKGYFKNKIRNGKVRYRLANHEEVRKDFEGKMRYIRTLIQEAKVNWSIAYDEFEETHPMESFDDVITYERK